MERACLRCERDESGSSEADNQCRWGSCRGNGDSTPPPRRDAAARPTPSALPCSAWLEPQLSEFGELGRMTDWGGKIVGATVRIAGLLHMADLAGADSPWTLPIPLATIERAISLAMYLIPHAKAAFAEMGADEIIEKAKAILR